ncbi:MAG: hypothetical protein AAGD07_15585 [Planctomycetota bacterium]
MRDTILRSVLSLLILGGGIASFQFLGVAEVPTRPPIPESKPLVETVAAIPHTQGISFEVDGAVVPYRQISIAAEVGGRVTYKADDCRMGCRVTKGELLVKIDATDYKLEVRRLEEELRGAESQINELEAEIATVSNQVEATRKQTEIDARQLDRVRATQLRKAASASEVDTAARTLLASQNQLQQLQDQKTLLTRRRARLESAAALSEANLEKANVNVKRTEIFSPIDAIVVNDSVEQDGYVQPGSVALILQDTSQVDVSCKLQMKQMDWLWQSSRVVEPSRSTDGPSDLSLETDAVAPEDSKQLVATQGMDSGESFPVTPARIRYELGGRTYQWNGQVDRYDGAGIDSQTRMVPCRIHVSDPDASVILSDNPEAPLGPLPVTPNKASDQSLLTGMFVKAVIDTRPPLPFLRVPQAALQPGNHVWIVVDGQLQRRDVRIATADQANVIVYQEAGGLKPGDAVVVSPMATPLEGALVLVAGSPEHAAMESKSKERRRGGPRQ